MENNRQPKKILIFSMSYYPRFVGGAEVALREITDRLSSTDFEFHLITLRYDSLLSKQEKIGNIFVHRIGFSKKSPTFEDLRALPLRLNKVLYQFLAPLVGLWLHRKIKFEKVWAMMAHSAGVPGNIFSQVSGVPLLLTLQEGDPTEHIERQMKIFGPLFSSVFKRAKQIQTISNFLKEWAIHMKARVVPEVVPNGVDGGEFLPSTEGVKREGFRLITTSRLVPKNGVDLVIEAMAKLPESVYFDIVGDGFQREFLEKKVAEYGLQKRIIFHGQKEKKEVIQLLQSAHVFIRPSRSEGLGNSFLEAMAVGLPVIGTPVGGIPDFLFDPKSHGDKATGLFCENENPQSIVQCVERLMSDEVLYKNICVNAKVLVQEKYAWDRIALKMKELLFV
jgi:glycosyltransferase involved in cell wall biosynthesis